MRTQWMASLLVMGLLIPLCGCGNSGQANTANNNRTERSTELVGQARPPVADLPVPVGFSLDEQRSRGFTTGGARWVDHVYKGSADKFAVARFYKRNMPINNWNLMTDMFVQGDIILTFEKEHEAARVVISDGSLFNPTQVSLQLWTKGQMPAPNERN
ncbi:MAG: hypothetical protein ACP5HU_12490 [Phycisphaerae bacterium]